MSIGIFNKIKKAFGSLGSKVKGLASKAIKALPQVVDTGKKIIGAVKPFTGMIPGVGNVINAVDNGLNIASTVGKFGKSILDEA